MLLSAVRQKIGWDREKRDTDPAAAIGPGSEGSVAGTGTAAQPVMQTPAQPAATAP